MDLAPSDTLGSARHDADAAAPSGALTGKSAHHAPARPVAGDLSRRSCTASHGTRAPPAPRDDRPGSRLDARQKQSMQHPTDACVGGRGRRLVRLLHSSFPFLILPSLRPTRVVTTRERIAVVPTHTPLPGASSPDFVPRISSDIPDRPSVSDSGWRGSRAEYGSNGGAHQDGVDLPQALAAGGPRPSSGTGCGWSARPCLSFPARERAIT